MSTTNSPPPPLDFNLKGETTVGQFRIRNSFCGAILEELVLSSDGSRVWRKAPSYQACEISSTDVHPRVLLGV